MEFKWIHWNVEHIARHGVTPEEAEAAVRSARRPFPRSVGEGKLLVWGRSAGGRWLQVVFVVEVDERVFVIHARPLTDREKRRLRRQER